MSIWELMRKTFIEKKRMRKIEDGVFSSAINDSKNIMLDFIYKTSDYLDPVNVQELLEENNNIYLNAKEKVSRLAFLNLNQNMLAKQFVDFYESYNNLVNEYNKEYTIKMVPTVKDVISEVENIILDNQQLSVIAKDVKNHLVIAGAGTGKTTTIIGYVKYLLLTKRAMCNELLILSFTNASSYEMAERLKKETGVELDVFTFHKLGLDIITKVEGKKPSVYSGNLSKFIKNEIKKLSNYEDYNKKLCSYFIFYSSVDYSEFDFNNYDEYIYYLKSNPPTSLKKEVLKSYGELQIANFLAYNGIKYQYEPKYKFETATKEYSQYRPDFYLPDYDVYIEYYGIDRNGNVANYFKGKNNKNAKESYIESMIWKDEIHKENNTKLIKLFAYEHFENILLDSLSLQLKKIKCNFSL